MTTLKISTEQMIALHGFFAAAMAVGEAAVAELSGCETETEVHEIRCCPLGEFGESGMRLSEDLVAGVMGRLEGAIPGSLNLVLEPEEALVWARCLHDADPLESFVSLGSNLLGGIARSLSEVLESEVGFVGAALVEEPELAMLVRTHAPSDTLVVSIRLQIEIREEVLTAVSHLLIEPKYLSPLLSGLSAASH